MDSLEQHTGADTMINPVPIITSLVPLYQKIWKWWYGNRVCIYGPSFSGKSTFWRYLAKGTLPKREERTPRTSEFNK